VLFFSKCQHFILKHRTQTRFKWFNKKKIIRIFIEKLKPMPIIKFTSALKRFFPDLQEGKIEGSTVAEVMQQLEKKYTGLSDFLLEENGQVRQHVNVFVGGTLIEDEKNLTDEVGEMEEILIFQALSGG